MSGIPKQPKPPPQLGAAGPSNSTGAGATGSQTQSGAKRRRKESVPDRQEPGSSCSQLISSLSATNKVLENELVLANIAKHLPTTSLLRLRRTCKQWNLAFLPVLASRSDCHVGLHTVCWDGATEETGDLKHFFVRTYIKLIQHSNPRGMCTNFTLADPTQGRYRELKDFFESVTTIKRLRLVLNHFGGAVNVDRLREIIFELVPRRTLQTLELSSGDGYRDNEDPPPPIWNKRRRRRRLTVELPNLRRLVVKLNEQMEAAYADLLHDLLKCAVRLESLTLLGNLRNNLASVPGMRMLCNLDKLKCLHIYQLKEPELQILVELSSTPLPGHRLRLHELTTSILCRSSEGLHTEVVGLLQQLLRTQSTLRTFCLGIDGFLNGQQHEADVEYSEFWLPEMESLHTLRIKRCGFTRCRLRYEGGSMRANFPELERFVYDSGRRVDAVGWYVTANDDVRVDDLNEGHEGVTELTIWGDSLELLDDDGEDEAWSPSSSIVDESSSSSVSSTDEEDEADDVDHHRRLTLTLPMFGSSFPSVTKLDVVLHSITTHDWCSPKPESQWLLLWTTWPGLTSLRVEHKVDKELHLDEMMSGIPQSNFKALRQDLAGLVGGVTLDKLRDLLHKYKTKAGLSDLKQLTKFHCGTFTQLTDIGGYFGLAMANPNLQEIVMERLSSTPSPISEECERVIRGAFGPDAIIRLHSVLQLTSN